MKDIAARELKGHNILAVERFWDSTFWMIEFTVLRPTAYEAFSHRGRVSVSSAKPAASRNQN